MSNYIVIEGLIGVGKTSLCRILRDELGARLVLEPAEDNPFLAAFYSDQPRFAFPAQMFYLATRYAQQADLRQGGLFEDLVVADYHFEKDQIFADLTLNGHEMDLYDRFAGLLGPNVPKPDFVVFLDSPTEIIRTRIARRAIDAEQVIEADYLDALRASYHRLWASYRDAPVYVLNTAEINYVDNPSDRKAVIEMIQGWLRGQPVPGAPASLQSEREVQPSLFGPRI
jgi:deoxyadenosine/deoxycytidine kinase